LASVALLYLALVVAVAALGGRWVGLFGAVASAITVNWFFLPPVHTFTIQRRDNVVAFVVYALVAVTVSELTEVAARARAAAERERAEAAAASRHADQLAEVDRLRAAILVAVGHDLRTPLAAIKAAASSLRSPDVTFTPAQQAELVAAVDESADRLAAVVENLLDSSRLQAGVLSAQPRPVTLDEVVARALLHADPTGIAQVELADDLPLAYADPGLLERVVANLITNALRHSSNVIIAGAAPDPHHVMLKVIDHGSGVSAADRTRMFAPFQRLDDRRPDNGLGLGLSIAKGFTESTGGRLLPTETPGGGLTMTVTLPAAAR
jgi:two-component system sensor histidine kinase KdpD